MNNKIPIALIIDDPPINAAYLMRKQMEERGLKSDSSDEMYEFFSRWEEMAPSMIVPNAFWKSFIEWSSQEGVKGKFTFLPCPGGLGRIDKEVEGYTSDELDELVTMIREEYPSQYDITPEVFTHTLAWDMENETLIPQTEPAWMGEQNEDTLTEYLSGALRILKNVGIPATGITQPCSFPGEELLFARAVQRSMKDIFGITHTYYFLNFTEDPEVTSPVMIANEDGDEYVVSIVSASKGYEPFWDTLYGEGDIMEMADYYISEDGSEGRFVDLLQTESPLIFHAHAQTLYSNGSEKGFLSLQEVVRRVNEHLSDRVEWIKISDFAELMIEEYKENSQGQEAGLG